jgi:hypothetical protein
MARLIERTPAREVVTAEFSGERQPERRLVNEPVEVGIACSYPANDLQAGEPAYPTGDQKMSGKRIVRLDPRTDLERIAVLRRTPDIDRVRRKAIPLRALPLDPPRAAHTARRSERDNQPVCPLDRVGLVAIPTPEQPDLIGPIPVVWRVDVECPEPEPARGVAYPVTVRERREMQPVIAGVDLPCARPCSHTVIISRSACEISIIPTVTSIYPQGCPQARSPVYPRQTDERVDEILAVRV